MHDSKTMHDSKRLATLIPTLRATHEAAAKALPKDPIVRYSHALLGQILTMLENGGRTSPRRDTPARLS